MVKITLLLLTLCLCASGQTKRVLRTIFVDAPKSAPKSVILYIAKESSSVNSRSLLPKGEAIQGELLRTRFSSNIQIPSGNLVAWILNEVPNAEEGIPAGAQKIRLPSSWSRIGLVFKHDPENKIFPAKVIPINLSAENFKPGNIMIYNLSKAHMVGRFGPTEVKLKPNTFKIIPTPISENKSYIANIDCILPDTKERFKVVSSRWVGYRNIREIKFMYDTLKNKKPRMWGIKDQP